MAKHEPKESASVQGAKPSGTRPATPEERRKRRRNLIQSFLVTFVLISAWIGIMVGYQLMSTSEAYTFRAETREVLERIRDGKAEIVYREASPRLQEMMISDRFLELSSDIRATLGGFRDILAIKQVALITGPGGKTGQAQATLEFDRGRAPGNFSYHWVDGKWRLLGLSIDIPDALKKEVASRSETRAVRVEADAEVHALVKKTLEEVRDGGSEAVYAQASPTFKQSIDRDTFLQVQEQRRLALGPYVRILDTLESWRDRSRSKAQVTVVVQYEKARTPVTIGFIKVDDVWRLAHYKVVMPQPRIPRLPEQIDDGGVSGGE